MIDRVKGWLSDWRITVALVGGALVVGTQWGSCTFQPAPIQEEAPVEAAEEAEAPAEAEAVEEAPAAE